MSKIDEGLETGLAAAKYALARGDISQIEEEMDELLAVFRLSLDRKGPPYRHLGLAILRRQVVALEALTSVIRVSPLKLRVLLYRLMKRKPLKAVR